jgi:hypothetical protein
LRTGGAGSLNGLQSGVVFAMSTDGEETVLHSFLSDADLPQAGGDAKMQRLRF